MTIALTHATVGEVPKAGKTFVANTSICIRYTVALTGALIAGCVLRSNAVTVTGLATFRAKSISSRRALITFPTDNIVLALTVASVLGTLITHRTSRITVASCGVRVIGKRHKWHMKEKHKNQGVNEVHYGEKQLQFLINGSNQTSAFYRLSFG